MDISTINVIIASTIALLGYLLKNRVDKMEKQIDDMQKDIVKINHEMQEFKMNYLDRFQKVNSNIADSKLEIIEKLKDLEIKLTHK